MQVVFIESQGVNCYVKGKKLYINYEIIHRLDEPLLRSLIDHELAHYKYHHIGINWLYFMVVLILAGLPMLLISLFGLWYAAIVSFLVISMYLVFYSMILWRQEYQADRYAVLYNGKETVIKMLITISNTDLFKQSFTHPSIRSRIDKINGQEL